MGEWVPPHPPRIQAPLAPLHEVNKVWRPQTQVPGGWEGNEPARGCSRGPSDPEGNPGDSSKVGERGPRRTEEGGLLHAPPRPAPPGRGLRTHRQRRPCPPPRRLRARPASAPFKSFLRPGPWRGEPWLSAPGCCAWGGCASGARGCSGPAPSSPGAGRKPGCRASVPSGTGAGEAGERAGPPGGLGTASPGPRPHSCSTCGWFVGEWLPRARTRATGRKCWQSGARLGRAVALP